MRLSMLPLLPLLCLCASEGTGPAPLPRVETLHQLKPDEGVFAYARASPSGRFLAYASQARYGESLQQVVNVVDLRRKTVVFSEAGLDAYWSNDERRLIFRSALTAEHQVAIWHTGTDTVVRNVAPIQLGDYYSFGARDGKDLVLTIKGYYYLLEDDRAVLPARSIPPCPIIGTGDRPLLSKDATRVTTFVNGTIHVRNLTNCDEVIDMQVSGAKADFSWDGKFIAFHAPKVDLTGYEIRVVDISKRTTRTVTHLLGSSLFPSWSRDGRLYFRYDGSDFRGFMRIVDPLAATERPIRPRALVREDRWASFFPHSVGGTNAIVVVLVWAPWSAHSPMALQSLQVARNVLHQCGVPVDARTASDIVGGSQEALRMLKEYSISLPYITDASPVVLATEATNQMPTLLMFRHGRLAERKLGARTAEDIVDWVRSASR